MIFLDSGNKNQVLAFIPLIRKNYADWHIVDIRFDTDNEESTHKVIEQFVESYKDVNGFIYRDGEQKAVSVIRLGKVDSYSEVQENIEENIKDKSCKVLAKKMSASGLKQIQINLSDKGEGASDNALFKEREEREKNVILIADDDMFIRKTLGSVLENVADIHEAEKGDEVLPSYKECNPDVVILDIHMPNENGLDVIKNLHKEDSNVFVIVSSFDSVKENVLESMERGAVSFLAKPVQKDKLLMCLEQCITFRSEEKRDDLCQINQKY